jgi:hypothetical protein
MTTAFVVEQPDKSPGEATSGADCVENATTLITDPLD